MLTVCALIAIAALMAICAATLVHLWLAARKQETKGDDGSCTDVDIDGTTKFLARIVFAAFIGMIPIVLDAPAAIAKPHSPMDCVPVGVTTKPDDSVWAVEDCEGGKIESRFGSSKSK